MSELHSWQRGGARRNFLDDLNQAARDNPVSAALIGAGVLWMLMGSKRGAVVGGAGSALGSVGRGTQQAVGMAASGVQNAADAAASGVRHAASALASGVSSAAESIGSTVSSIGSSAADMARSAGAGGAVRGATRRANNSLGSAYDYGSDAAGRASQSIASSASDMSRAAQERLSDWSDTARHGLAETFEQQPLLLGAVGFALGAAVAAALPVTETENRTFGQASDGLKEMVTDLVAEKAESARDMAQSALQEAEAQGLTPKAATEAVQNLVDKLGTVAEKSGNALKESMSGAGDGRATTTH